MGAVDGIRSRVAAGAERILFSRLTHKSLDSDATPRPHPLAALRASQVSQSAGLLGQPSKGKKMPRTSAEVRGIQ